MEKENNVQTDTNVEIPKEVTLGKFRYLHTSDEEWDYLVRTTDNGVKVTLKFTKDEEKNKAAMEAIRTFFSQICL